MEKIENLNALAEELDESSKLSWLWCLFFGPLWFAFIGSWKWFSISLLAAIVTAGLSVIILPFFAYKAHRDVAMAKAVAIL